MPSTSLRRTRCYAAQLAVVVSLAACGTINPGQAVVVDDHALSMDSLNDLSAAYCELNAVINAQQAAQGAQAPASSGGDARRQAAQAYISNTMAKEVAASAGVSVPPSAYRLTGDQRTQVEEAFKGRDLSGVQGLLEDNQQTQLLLRAIGAEQLGVPLSADVQDKAQAAGQAAVQKATEDADLTVDPRLGLSATDAAQIGTSGSLSVTPSADATATGDLPASQQCR